MLTPQIELKVKKLAAGIRRDIVEMIGGEGHTGHLGGSCSCADIVAALYAYKMKHDPKNPKWEGRDRLLFSKGHAAVTQYAALGELGYFDKEILLTYKNLGSMLQGHPDRNKTPGVEAHTGSLGQGLSICNGIALALKLDCRPNKVFCIIGDGEMAEGQIWEAAMASANYKLDNLIVILDRNRLQAMGRVTERFDTNPIPAKWAAFGFEVLEIDGHDIHQIADALDKTDTIKGKPAIIIADTIKGKGISFAENVVAFHNSAFTKEQFETACRELDSALEALERGGI